MLRLVRLQRRSAIDARTRAANQLHAVIASAPEPLRAQLRDRSIADVVNFFHRQQVPRARRVRFASHDLEGVTRLILRGLAERWSQLNAEIRILDTYLKQLIEAVAPALLKQPGIGPEVASALLVAAGDNPERLRNERSFAALCGVAPLDASSGRQQRHRLNRGGNRDANRALWVIAFVRWRMHAETKKYAARRTAEGRTKLEILRCLKRYIAREIFKLLHAACLNAPHATPA